jgi:hypothetical protein
MTGEPVCKYLNTFRRRHPGGDTKDFLKLFKVWSWCSKTFFPAVELIEFGLKIMELWKGRGQCYPFPLCDVGSLYVLWPPQVFVCDKGSKFWGALCRSMSPNSNVPNIYVLHINGSLLQPRVVEVQSTLAVPKALQINGSIHQRTKFFLSKAT